VSDCEELVGVLTGVDVTEMLMSAFRSRRSISLPVGSKRAFPIQQSLNKQSPLHQKIDSGHLIILVN